MEHSQLVKLIQTLKSDEKAQILDFSTIPYFNKGRMKAQVIPLLKACLQHPWDDPEQRLEKKTLFATVFPGQDYLEGKLEKVMVEANKVVKTFLLTQRYLREENEFNQLIDFSEEVKVRGLHSLHQQNFAKLQKIQDESAPNSLKYHQRQFVLEYAKYEAETVQNQAKGDLNIPQALQSLEINYYLNRLILLNQFLLQQKIAHLEVPENVSRLLEGNEVPKEYLEQSISLKINLEVFNLLKKKSPEAADVQSLFDVLLAHENNLDPGSLADFYAFLRNLCVLSIAGDYEKPEMAYLLHELYTDNLSRGYLHSGGKISRSKYMGVANNALFIGKFDWALAFIEQYKHELQDENETQDIYRLNLANYYFKVGRFADCLDTIPDTSPYLLYFLQGKRLELKSLYELDSELLPYKLDAFKMFLSRTSQKLLSDSQRQMHAEFANLLHQIISSNPGDPKRSELLTKRIQGKKQAAEWRWLLEKAQALKGK